ncbi:MAG: hypothetical protein QOI34_1738 [Verrucomicrobiota bacterium]|jgi:hypothetical protein
MARSDDLPALTAKISATLAMKPEMFVTHPAELRILKVMTDEEVGDFALEHGWRVVRRIGGRQIEFYNDASARPAERQS